MNTIYSYGEIRLAVADEGWMNACEIVYLEGGVWAVIGQSETEIRAVRLDRSKIHLLPRIDWHDRMQEYYDGFVLASDAKVFPRRIKWAVAGDPLPPRLETYDREP